MYQISITDRAASKIKELVSKEGNPELALRIFVSGGCCSYKYEMVLDDKVHDDDVVIQNNGVKIIMDGLSAQLMQGSEIDYLETPMGTGFVVNNPNVTSTCCCGHSSNTAPTEEQ